MDIKVLIPALAAGFFAARLGQRITRERAEAAAWKPKRITNAGLTAAVSVALGAIGLTLAAVMVLVQHKAPPRASALFVVMLAVGILGHARARRETGPTDDA